MSRIKGSKQQKVRPDSVLRQLPEERQMQIYADLEKRPVAKVKASLKADGLEVCTTALYNFGTYWRSELRFMRYQAQRQSLLAQMLIKQDPLKLEKVKVWADAMFIQEAVADGNLPGYVKMRTLIERSRQTDMDERRLAILEAKEKKLADVEKNLKERKAAGGLTPETLEVIESALGMI
ncbi:MAG: hypothetical protein V4726_07270 [Verrucomicrobiota bacterium]